MSRCLLATSRCRAASEKALVLVARVPYPLCKRHPHDRLLLTLLELLGDVRGYTLVTLAPRTGLVAVVVLNLFALAYSSRLARSLALSLFLLACLSHSHTSVRSRLFAHLVSFIHCCLAVCRTLIRQTTRLSVRFVAINPDLIVLICQAPNGTDFGHQFVWNAEVPYKASDECDYSPRSCRWNDREKRGLNL